MPLDISAERFFCYIAVFPQLERVAEGVRNLRARVEVSVAGERWLERQLVVDAVQPGSNHRRDRQVRVHVAAWRPVLHPQGVAVADQAQRAGPVVDTPADGGRRE